MKLPVLLIVFLGSILVNANTFHDCDLLLNGVSIPFIFDLYIQDDQKGIILNLTTVDVDFVKFKGSDNDKYFYQFLSTSKNTFELEMSSLYLQMENEKPSHTEPTRLLLPIEVLCKAKYNTLYFDIYVTDNNNHKPEFTYDEFKYVIPLPFPPTIPLQLFGSTKNITAKDIDIENDIVTFKIIPDNVFDIITTKDNTDNLGKTYIVDIVVGKPITSLETTEFVLIAMDKDGVESKPKIVTIIGNSSPECECSCNNLN